MEKKWFEILGVEDIITPSLVVYPDRIEENIKRMINMAGGTESLRPHIKTHKILEIIKLQMKHGIFKFKCATIAEAELLAFTGAKDVLLAIQPVGIHVDRFFSLIEKFSNTKFSTLVDCEYSIQKIQEKAELRKRRINLWLDINNGMNRTGVPPNAQAQFLYEKIEKASYLVGNGLHVYDGHIHESDLELRTAICEKDFEPVLILKKNIEEKGIKIACIVAGGTPTFPIHIKRKNIEVSPGTPLLWDYGYDNNYKDLKFHIAAVLIGTIISKPNEDLLCLNLGHKSVAAEMDFPRLHFLNKTDFEQVSHSEEHLVVTSKNSSEYPIGTICYAVPTHICPTVLKYRHVLTVRNKRIDGHWKVAARDQSINV